MRNPAAVIVRAAAWLVPADIRRDWRREWEAELAWSRCTGTRTWLLTLRALGAWPHACWLRWDRWRIEMLWYDLAYAARTLVRRPGYAAIAILSLAIGIGANTTMFSVVHAVLLRPLPYPDPDALVHVWTTTPDRAGRGYESTPPDFVDWRRDTPGFREMSAYVAGASALTGDGPAEQIPSASVTGGFFAVLGVPALHGRGIATSDDPDGSPDVVVLSHSLWQRRFGSDPMVVGRTVQIEGRAFAVVGVMPPRFEYPLGAELWIPLRFTAEELRTQRGAHYLDVIARLAPGTTGAQGTEALRATAARLAVDYPRTNASRTVAVEPLRDAMVGDVRRALLLLLGAVGFVLLIVCVNVANLGLTRALGRQRELAVRTALGAGRGRLVRGLLAESAWLALAGGGAGLLGAMWATRVLRTLEQRTRIPLIESTQVDLTVFAFAAMLAILTVVLVGTLPAWQASARLELTRAVREESGATSSSRRQRIGGMLIVSETSLAVVLLIGAGLLMRSFLALAAVDLGIRTEGVQTFTLSLPESRYATPVARATLVQTLLDRLDGWPQVEAAGAVFGLPLTNFGYVISMTTLDGRQLDDAEQDARSLQVRVVTPGYLRALGIPLRAGRSVEMADRLGAPPVVLVNETAAHQLWPGSDPIGHSFTLGTRLGQGGLPVGGTVVGVVGDVRDGGPASEAKPTMYVAHAQFPTELVSVAIRMRSGDASAAVAPVRELLAGLDPALPMFRVRSMDQLAQEAVARPRLLLTLLGVFSGAAIVLAAIGIYGVLAHGVSRRTKEIGLRLALGAPRRAVLRMVIGQAAALTGAGLAIGLLMAAALGRLLGSLLFGVQPADAVTYLAVSAGLCIVALAASTLPALRASRVDPIAALRTD